MSAAGALGTSADAFERSRTEFLGLVAFLEDEAAGGLAHSELEGQLQDRGRELLRGLFQDHLDLRAVREQRIGMVRDVEGRSRGTVERAHDRALCTVFGKLSVGRLAYRQRGCENLYPADASLNLPVESHSHGLRRLAAIEASRGSFDEARKAIGRATCQQLGKRQIEQLAARGARDFHAFYAQRQYTATADEDVLVLSCDGKGVVMRHDALRPQTAKAATSAKLKTRLSKGEKRNRKRMAEVGAVYQAAPAPRTTADVLPHSEPERTDAVCGPVARDKWLTASVVDNAADVVSQVFGEADRRDLAHTRTWVALVDGNNHQIARIQAEAQARQLDVAIVCDFVHVIEYLWKAAWSFHKEGDPAAEAWVRRHAKTILDGAAKRVAATIRRAATTTGLPPAQRAGADTCARYLTNKHAYLDYPTALKAGWPIATGVIEGACRHLVKDRMDLTGARWGLQGAEAILKLRAIRSNNDFDEYWAYHLAQEHQRVHLSRYANRKIPEAA
jgi:hypothetical protein